MCYAPVSGHEVVMYFRVEGSYRRRGLKEMNQESKLDRERVRTR